MKSLFKKILWCFIAGCIGGIATNVVNLILGSINVLHYIGVDTVIDSNIAALYTDILLRGLWGFLFLIPFLKNTLLVKGTILSLIPTVITVFFIIPKLSKLGIESNLMLPVYILLLNIVWGLVAALFLSYSRKNNFVEFHK